MSSLARFSNLDRLSGYAGATFKRILTLTNSEDGSPLNLSGVPIWFTIKAGEDSASPLIEKSIGSGIAIISEAQGQALITLEEGETAGLPTGKTLLFEVSIRPKDGELEIPIQGTIVFFKRLKS